MPIYEYACGSCGHRLDALQKISDPFLTDCPDCGEAALKRQLSAPRFRLKGSGWYETDFKTGDKRNIAGDKDKSADGGNQSDHGDKAGKKDGDKAPSATDSKTASVSAGSADDAG